MNTNTKTELKKYFDNFDEQIEIIDELESNLLASNLDSLMDNILFYNHYISFYSRVINDIQNNLEFELSEEITLENYNKSKKFIDGIKSIKDKSISSFEIYLLAIYFAQEGRN